MAGIGWKLEQLIDRDTFGSSIAAMLTGVAVTSGPWLLTTALLVLMRVSAVTAGIEEVTSAERVITIVYAVAIVMSAPIDIVLTRFSADCVYTRSCDRIAAPLCRALAVILIAFTGLGAIAMHVAGVDRSLAIPGAILAAIVGGQWLLLSAAGGLSSPGIILRAFAVGAPVSAITWLVIIGPMGMGPVGYLLGFGAGQLVTLGVLLWGTLRALPATEDTSASLLEAAREYVALAIAAFAFNAGLWVDKLMVLVAGGGDLASQYAALAAVAWLSIVPACAYLFVIVETSFHRRFHAFYSGLHEGASLADLRGRVAALREQVNKTLMQTSSVQMCVTLVCLLAAPAVVGLLELGGPPPVTVLWLVAGAGLQVVAFAAILLLYYFDFRAEALVASATQLVTNALFTLAVGAPSQSLGAGYAASCAVTSLAAVVLLRSRLPGLLPRTFQSQPDLTET